MPPRRKAYRSRRSLCSSVKMRGRISAVRRLHGQDHQCSDGGNVLEERCGAAILEIRQHQLVEAVVEHGECVIREVQDKTVEYRQRDEHGCGDARMPADQYRETK